MSFPAEYLNYIDKHKMITQHGKDGADEGDSAFFVGHVKLLNMLYPGLIQIPSPDESLVFPLGDGRLSRHAKAQRAWIRRLDRGSRDQYTSWICLAVTRSLSKNKGLLNKITFLLLRRFGFFTNTRKNGILDAPLKVPDYVTPEVLLVFLRGYLKVWGYPLYIALDLYIFLDAVWTKYFKDDNDVANFLSVLLTCHKTYPTLFTWLAIKISTVEHYKPRLEDYFTISLKPNKRTHKQNPTFIGKAFIEALEKEHESFL